MLQIGRRRVAIAGATGFVGRALAAEMRSSHEVIGLSRRAREPGSDGPHQWRACDLFSLLQVEEALAGADVAIYLVHSMMPTARLTQATFEDLDLILADNFGRACAKAGVRHIVYLGGLIPPGVELSAHLRSRLEVEAALGAHGVVVTSLRAGLIVGAKGSSFQMLVRLVERLPAMLCPKWTLTKTQPIALADVVSLLEYCARDTPSASNAYDIGGPDVLTYREMLGDVARELGRAPLLAPAPLFSPRLSRLWVSLVTGTPGALVGPLVESLRYPMLARDRSLQARAGIPGIGWRDALRVALAESDRDANQRATTALGPRSPPDNVVKSVQRLPLPAAMDAFDIAREYLSWLPRLLWPLIRVQVEGHTARFSTSLARSPLLTLELAPERCTRDRTLFYVTGGSLARTDRGLGRLEFRVAPDGEHLLAAIHEFRPRLPWYLYRLTQARAHAWVMRRFAAHLRRVGRCALAQARS